VSERKILGRVLWGTVPPRYTEVLPPNPRRLTLSFAGNIGDYNIMFGQNTDQSAQLVLETTAQNVVTFTRETLGTLLGLSVYVAGASGNWCIIETWEG